MRKLLSFLLLFLLIPAIAFGANMVYPKFKCFDSNGDPCSGWKVYTYTAGTAVAATSYSDYDLSTANTNPVVLDSNGEALIFSGSPLKLILKNADGVTQWTVDNIYGAGQRFSELVDTPTSLTANAFYKVNAGGTALEATTGVQETSTLTLAGDIYAYDGSDVVRVPGGSTGQILTMTSGPSSKLAWSDAPSRDMITRGLELVYKNADMVIVNPGSLVHGAGTGINMTSPVTLTLAKASDYADSSATSYTGWCYVGIDDDGDVKLLEDNPPDVLDTSGNTQPQAVNLYWDDSAGTSGEIWRVIGRIRVASLKIPYDFQQKGDYIFYKYTQSFNCGTSSSFSTVDISSLVSEIDDMVYLMAASSDGAQNMQFRTKGDTATTGQPAVRTDIAASPGLFGWFFINDPADRNIDYFITGGATMTGYVKAVHINVR